MIEWIICRDNKREREWRKSYENGESEVETERLYSIYIYIYYTYINKKNEESTIKKTTTCKKSLWFSRCIWHYINIFDLQLTWLLEPLSPHHFLFIFCFVFLSLTCTPLSLSLIDIYIYMYMYIHINGPKTLVVFFSLTDHFLKRFFQIYSEKEGAAEPDLHLLLEQRVCVCVCVKLFSDHKG